MDYSKRSECIKIEDANRLKTGCFTEMTYEDRSKSFIKTEGTDCLKDDGSSKKTDMENSKSSSFVKMDDFPESNVSISLSMECDDVEVSCAITKRGRKRKRGDPVDFDPEIERKRITANSQERVRMHKINEALEELKKCLPQQFQLYHRRMSKIRTLRLAMNYITSLSELIRDDDRRRQGDYTDVTSHTQVPGPAATPVMYEMPTLIPYYPYIPECHPYTAIESMHRTPDQQPSQFAYNPRQLNFNTMSSCVSSVPQQDPACAYTGSMFSPIKHRAPKRLFQGDDFMNNPESVRACMRTETVSSAYQGARNPMKLISGFVGASCDADDQLEPGQIRSRDIGPYRALMNIVDEDC